MSLTEAPSCPVEQSLPTQIAEPKRRPRADAPAIVRSTASDQRRPPGELDHARTAPPDHLVLEANEITFKVGDVVLKMTQENGGTLEIRAPHVRILGEEVLSEAVQTNSVVGGNVVTEAKMHSDMLGKLIRIDGQFVKINS